jgi:hypothetical protein
MTVTYYGTPGTWAWFDAGFQADVARGLVSEWDAVASEVFGTEGPAFRWQGVNYPAAFGPINPPPWAPNPPPSYDDSVKAGVVNHIQLINNIPGKFIIGGYSQGAEVTGRIRKELVSGSLQHRLADCKGSITFGDPTRQASDEVYGGGDGIGISRLVIPPCPFRCVTYAAVGDMYCTTPASGATGDDMHAMYMALTSLGGTLSIADMMTQALGLLVNPLAGGLAALEAMIRAMKVGAHGSYGGWVGHAIGVANQMAG